MEVDLLLENNQLFIHLDLQVVLACLDLGLELVNFLQLLILETLALVVGVLCSQVVDALLLLDLKDLKFFSVVHGLLDSLVDGHKLLVLLHVLQLVRRLDLHGLDRSVQLLVEQLHLLLVLATEVFHFDVAFLSEHIELSVPVTDELLQLFIADLDVFLKLSILDVNAQLILVDVHVSL